MVIRRKRGETEEYTRGIPNDFGSFGKTGAPQERSQKSQHSDESEKKLRGDNNRARVARMVFFALNRLSFFDFYLGQTGIRLNALIKLLTSYGLPGGHRVSLWARAGLFLPGSSVLSFIFVPPLRTASRSSYFTFDHD